MVRVLRANSNLSRLDGSAIALLLWHGKRFRRMLAVSIDIRHGRIPECSGHGNRGIRGANRAN